MNDDERGRLLTMDGVTFSYGAEKAVDRLSMSVTRGSVVGLIGPNGSGKTTALRLAAGLLSPLEGEVTLDGCQPNEVSVRTKSRLAFAPDAPTGFDHLTVDEYFEFYAALQGVGSEFIARTHRIGTLWRLDGYKRKYLGELNFGNRRKVAIIAAVALLRPLTLIDEAVSGLDPDTTLSFTSLVAEMQNRGCSFLIATQNVDFAERVCDRVYLIVDGGVFAAGSPSELRSEYGTQDLIGVFSKAGFAPGREEVRDALGGARLE